MPLSRLADHAQVRLDTLLQQAVDHRAVPNVVAVLANREEVLYRGAVGASLTSLYRIASMTKPITSVAIMLLQERGLLALDDPLARYLPAFAEREVICAFNAVDAAVVTRPAAGPITLRHLLTHTAGFGYDFCNEILFALCRDGKQSPRTAPLLHDPGQRWNYGCATAILGDVIAQVTNAPFYTFLETQILQPLGMVDTGYFLKPADRDRLVPLHFRVDRDWVSEPPSKPYEPFPIADGGLLGTADDYIRFLQMLLNLGTLGETRLLTAHTVRTMISNQIGSLTVVRQPGTKPHLARPFPLGADEDKFGFGFQLKTGNQANARSPGSYSWAGLFNTHFWADPQKGIAAVLFTQLLPFYDDQYMRLLCDFEEQVYKNLLSDDVGLANAAT